MTTFDATGPGSRPHPEFARRLARPAGLRAERCTVAVDPSTLGFETTDELEPLDSVIRQDRAWRSLELGVGIRRRNYHVFVAGPSGTGRRTLVREVLGRIAPERDVPPDVAYVHHFDDEDRPLVLHLAPGDAAQLSDAMDGLLEHLQEALPQAFEAPDHQVRLQSLLGTNQVATNDAVQALKQQAKEVGFDIEFAGGTHLEARPIVDDEPLDDEQLFALDPETRQAVEEHRVALEPLFKAFVATTRELENDAQETIETLQRELGEGVVAGPIAELRERFQAGGETLIGYLDKLQEWVLDHLKLFVQEDDPEVQALTAGQPKRDPFQVFRVNVVVDRADSAGAPVVFENQPTFHNLFGKIERKVEQGIYSTDHMMIDVGSLAEANGGFLVCHAEDLLRFPGVWDHLKLVLRNGEVAIVDLGDSSGILPTSGLKPEPIPLDFKLVLLGSNATYHALYALDEDFQKIFQVKVDFDHEIERNEESEQAYVRFLAGSVSHNGCRPLSADGAARVLRHSSRLVGSQKRLTLRANQLGNLLVEADYHAGRRGADRITAEHIATAVRERTNRSSLIADKMFEDLADGSVLLSASGGRVGVVNGLAVLEVGEHAFGRPFRITARTFAGEMGVVNIEREVAMSGELHDKGVQLIAGFLGDRFAQHAPLAMTATVAFEQSYSTVDGDSASSTWLFAILSALAGAPIDQGVAVTGSVNQLGEIQPVGGVTEKVEGHFRFCVLRGLTGDQGVIIPASNVDHLMLDEPVLEAIAAGRFHVWPIATVEEGLELLTGMPAGVPDATGCYAAGSVLGRVADRLDRLRQVASPAR